MEYENQKISMKPKSKLLTDHKQVGKKFYPLASKYGWTEIHYVENILPEIAWMGFFLKILGRARGIAVVLQFTESCFRLRDWGMMPNFCFLSKFSKQFVDDDWIRLRALLQAKDLYLSVLDCIIPFFRCYPTGNPFARLSDYNDRKPSLTEIETARAVASNLFDRRSKPATLVQSISLWVDIKVGSYHVPTDYPYQTFDTIFGDVESDNVSESAAHARMHVNSSHQFRAYGNSWAKYFWNRGVTLSPPKAGNDVQPESANDFHPVVRFGRDYECYAWGVIDEIWSKLPIDIYESEMFEVLGALLARQCNMAIKLAGNVDLWDYHAGPLFLRPMTDCCITVAWILKDGVERARKLIIYGLGQEKLEIERLKSVLDEQRGEDRLRMEERIRAQSVWLDAQHYSFLQHVDLGSWSGITTRKMAEEAGRLNLYDFAYVGWSHAAHGTWNHIGKFDARPSAEALHKHIWQPTRFDHGSQSDVVIQATKYFDEACFAVVEFFHIEMSAPRPNEWLKCPLNELSAGMQEQHLAMVETEPERS